MGINVAQLLRQPALRHPERVALVVAEGDHRREVTYGALDAAARTVAAALRAGERVALSAANGADFVAGWFGAAYAGCTVVPLPTASTARELVIRLDHACCRTLIVDEARRDVATRAAAATARPVAVRLLSDLVAGDAAVTRPRAARADDPAMILYTSGTTGRAKGAVIGHGSLVLHTAALAQHALRLDPRARVLGALPLTHSYGCRMVMLATFYAGARAVLVPRFSARGTLGLMRREGVTWAPAVPTMFSAWAEADDDGPPPPALRWCLSAGAPLAVAARERAEARLGVEIREGYGMTEATFSTMNAPPAPRVPGCVGRPVWGVEVRVVDHVGNDVPPGAAGELLLRGHNQMLGYLDDDRATALTVREGWVHSGDVARVDGDGRVWVVDRKRDLILKGGHSVYPSEVEDALSAHPAIAGARVASRGGGARPCRARRVGGGARRGV